jgi:hypothetical protein
MLDSDLKVHIYNLRNLMPVNPFNGEQIGTELSDAFNLLVLPEREIKKYSGNNVPLISVFRFSQSKSLKSRT